MSKLNVTEGEWFVHQDEMTNLYVIDTSEDEEGFSEGITENVYDKNDAILMSRSKNLYNEIMQDVISLEEDLEYTPKHSGEYEHLKNLIEHKSKLLAQCRGEQHTCKN